MISISKCEPVKLKEGVIYLGSSSAEQSVGYLELNPKQSLAKHNRPVDEKLIQVEGQSIMILFENENGKRIMLNKGQELVIPANRYHIHSNESNEKSITYWEFNGDITEIINKVRKLSE